MHKSSTMYLRAAVLGLGIFALVICIALLPAIYKDWGTEYPNADFLRYPVLIALSVTVPPFYFALYQALKLLSSIDKNMAFSRRSIKALKYIKYSALTMGLIYGALLPVVHYITQEEDAPGLMIIGLFLTFGSFAVATFAGVLQKLLLNAIVIKSENDLTV